MSDIAMNTCHHCGVDLKYLPTYIHAGAPNDHCGECGYVHVLAACQKCEDAIWKPLDNFSTP